MIDVYRGHPIDEKSDIWALGVLLYKLCYYTTPFEEVGQMAILNASYKFPSYPPFSDRLKRLIGNAAFHLFHGHIRWTNKIVSFHAAGESPEAAYNLRSPP